MEENKNQIALFEQKYLSAFQDLQQMKKAKETLEKREIDIKNELLDAMKEYGIKSIKNEYITISYVDGTTTETIDLKALQEKEPELYKELLEDYKKTTIRNPYVKFVIK
ncbi:MAG: hypothetical protein SPJ27_07585 [Candidatus Onthovivens sp.]|nr:hypothetical protein [Candidatus Onthovivens sp.]